MNDQISNSNRRQFLSRLGIAAAAQAGHAADTTREKSKQNQREKAYVEDLSTSIDFRYAPLRQQAAICFPDDVHKSLVGEMGDLRLGHPGAGRGTLDDFRTVARFSMLGMEHDVPAVQRLEAPGIPIIHTRLDRPEAYLEITSFGSREPGEGRVDNVLLEIRPKTSGQIAAMPRILLQTSAKIKVVSSRDESVATVSGDIERVLFIADAPAAADGRVGNTIALRHGIATEQQPLQYFLRFPAEGQPADRLRNGLQDAQKLIANVRLFWREWRPFSGDVDWRLSSRYNEFLIACTRNILQAREMRNGRLTFQVGPTVYRGLWVVDGNFILEAARYLGYDKEAGG